jgi:uncharacterized membrane protein HdeD (DUF308 family)
MFEWLWSDTALIFTYHIVLMMLTVKILRNWIIWERDGDENAKSHIAGSVLLLIMVILSITLADVRFLSLFFVSSLVTIIVLHFGTRAIVVYYRQKRDS